MFFLVLYPVSKPFCHYFDQFINLVHEPRLQIIDLCLHSSDIGLDLVQTAANNQLGVFKSGHPISQVPSVHWSALVPIAVVVVVAVLDATVE